MGFAIPFIRGFNYIDQNVQLNINYKPKIKELDNFIEKYGSHRINLKFPNHIQDHDIEILNALKEKYPECQLVICMQFFNEDLDKYLNKYDFPYYYNEIITTWDRFQGFLKLNVCDIFIGEDLAFDAKNASFNAKKNNKSLRCYCNVCESSWEKTPSIKTFFIRPEDLEVYENYINTFEFYTDERDLVRLNSLYKIYAKDREWYGQFKELITGFQGEEDSRYIIPRFGEQRVSCGKKCMKGIPPVCQVCDRIIELQQAFKKQGIVVSLEEKK